MTIDHIILIAIGLVAIFGGLYLLSEAKAYRERHQAVDKQHHKGAKHA